MTAVRLQKYCSEKGLLSRREAEHYIKNGWITVNGVVAEIGQKIDPLTDKVVIQGPKKKKLYVKYYKPRGVVTNCPQAGEKQISDVIAPRYKGLSAIGRLDKESEGLIFLTNDGTFSKKFLDPSIEHEREYYVEVTPAFPKHMLPAFEEGIVILGQKTKPAKTRPVSSESAKTRPGGVRPGKTESRQTKNQGSAGLKRDKEPVSRHAFYITLTEGKNRQIRRMVAKFGCEVVVLKRVRIESVLLGDMQPNDVQEIGGGVL